MSKIEWTDKTWNPVTGCSKTSPGCDNCYAEMMHKRLRGMGNEKYKGLFGVPRCHRAELNRDFGRKPKRIFVCSMSDLFHINVPHLFLVKVLNVIKMNPHHTFQILTKRPGNAFDFQEYRDIEWPENIWFGVTAENQEQFDNRVNLLCGMNIKNTFVSIEPMLGPITITPDYFENNVFQWVILGGETGPGARDFDIESAGVIRDQCKESEVPFFFKQMPRKETIPAEFMIKQFPEGM